MNECSICKLVTKSSRELYHHLKTRHYGNVHPDLFESSGSHKNETKSKPNHEHWYHCETCMDQFSSLRDLFRHLGNHFEHQEGPPNKRRRLDTKTNQPGSGIQPKDKKTEPQPGPNGIQQNEMEVEPKPGPSGIQLRIDQGRLRKPTEHEMELDRIQDEEPANNIPNSYQLEEISRNHNQRFGADNITYRLKVHKGIANRKISEVLGEMYSMFNDLVTNLRNDLQDGDLVRFYLNHPILHTPITISARPIEELSVEDIMTEVEKVLQSEEELKLDEQFEIHVGILRLPRGGRGKYFVNKQHGVSRKRSIVEIQNTQDNLCFDRAVVVCLAKLEAINSSNDSKKKRWKKIINKNCLEQFQSALKLRKSVGLPEEHFVTVQDMKLYEEKLDIRIVVIDNNNTSIPIYPGNSTKARQIYILKDSNHYHSIISIVGFHGKNHFCATCLKAYNGHNHNCASTCSVCESNDCLMVRNVNCSDCNMVCRSDECFARHKKPKGIPKKSTTETTQSLCQKFWYCSKCHSKINRNKRSPEAHTCGEYVCNNCHQYVTGLHLCYQRYAPPKPLNNKFIFFDFESRQDDKAECSAGYLKPSVCPANCESEVGCVKCVLCRHCKNTWCGKYKHLANFAIAQTVCDNCIIFPLSKNSKCVKCGIRCVECKGKDKKGNYLKEPCAVTCGFQERIFRGDRTADQLAEWMFDRERSGFTSIAHNSGGYDSYFLLDYLLKNGKTPDNIIYQGSHITFMEVRKDLNIRLIDSLKFLPMRLSKLSSVFGLKEAKGWFPHHFNKKENWNYIGPYPSREYFGFELMNEVESEHFNAWYQEKVHMQAEFNFQEEIEHYCRLDVNILREACLQYRKLLLDVTKTKHDDKEQPSIDPWQEITIASVCSQVYRSKFLEETWKVKIDDSEDICQEQGWLTAKSKDGLLSVQTEDNNWVPETDVKIVEKQFLCTPIAQIPSGGYTKHDNYSKISVVWLEWLMEQKRREGEPNYHITHALNGMEKRIPHTSKSGRKTFLRVDGFHDYGHQNSDQNSGLCLDFHGCRYHGHSCIKGDRQHKPLHPHTKQTADQLYQATLDRENYIKSLGFDYVSIWECDFRKEIQENPELKNFYENIQIEERLNPRNGFMGGRTNATKLYYKTKENEMIKYYDVTSLYAYTNKYEKYMDGHCSVITGLPDNTKICDYFGMAHVRILPPRGLLHPVLPVKMDNKLLFPLCKTFAQQRNQEKCTHSDPQRELIGTWCTPELVEAENRGYKIKKIHEIYHWDKTTQYNPETGDQGLFAEYINTFLKIKQESSGWPSWCIDETKKSEYIQMYKQKENIELDPNKIEKNPGLRSLAKSKLTNFWGKFGQKENQLQTKFIDNIASLCELLVNENIKIHDFQVINENVLLVQYKLRQEFAIGGGRSNIFIAAMTTCHARLKLYREIARLGERVLYFDTDSIVFISRPGEYEPPLGNFLGEFTDELTCKEIGCKESNCTKTHYITEFISAGPKNYSFKTDVGTKRAWQVVMAAIKIFDLPPPIANSWRSLYCTNSTFSLIT